MPKLTAMIVDIKHLIFVNLKFIH